MHLQSRSCLAAIPISLLVAGCDGAEKKAAATPPAPPPAVTVVTVQAQDIRPTVSFTGRVEARDKVDLRARIDGFLEKRLFTEGQDVKEGDLLFTIEKGQYQAAVDQISGTLIKAEAALKLGDLDVERQKTLVEKDVGRQALLDQVVAKQGAARGDLAQQKAALENAKLNLSYTDIRAPISGRIGKALFSVGNFVGPGSGTLATIVAQDPIYVTFPVSQREILALRKANPEVGKPEETAIFVELADGSRYAKSGTLNFVDVTVNQGTDTVQVRASFPNPDRALVDGQLVSVIAETGKAKSTLLIPQQAVQIDQAGPFVLVIDSASKVEVRRVEIAAAPGESVAVTKGLSAGDKVLTEGIQKVRPGQVVAATEAKPGA